MAGVFEIEGVDAPMSSGMQGGMHGGIGHTNGVSGMLIKTSFQFGGSKGGSGFPIFGTMKTSAYLTNPQSRFASFVFVSVHVSLKLREQCTCQG